MKKKFDYVIVGAGAAGSVLAARLSEDPAVSVLVLEAGPSDLSVFIRMPGAQIYPILNKRRTWRFNTGPEPFMNDRDIMHIRGRMMGGSTSLNGMVYVRGNPRDFDNWANMGLPDWSYAHCLPYFKKLESFDQGGNEYRGDDGPVSITTNKAQEPIFQAFLAAGQQAGQALNPDYNGYRQEGVHQYQANLDNGIRDSAGRAYLRPALKRKQVEIRLHALVSKVRFDGSNRAVGVEYITGDDTHFVEAEREVILCGGAYNSPHILMLSGVGPTNHLAEHNIPVVSDLAGVGQGLQDHLCVPVKYRSARKGISPGVGMNPIKMGWTGAQWLFARRGLGATNLWETGSFFKSREDVEYVDIQHEFVPLIGEYGQDSFTAEDGFYYSTCLMRPESRGAITLKSADPKTMPNIVNNYLQSKNDQRVMIDAVRITDDIIQQPAWDDLRGEALSPALRTMADKDVLQWLQAEGSTQYHPSATCRMGVDDMAVVDSQGRVNGVQNLRVVDASIMPKITSGNLNSPTMMLAEKIADRIKGGSLPPQHTKYADMI